MLPEDFWIHLEQELMSDIEAKRCQYNYRLDCAIWIAGARVIVTRRLAEVLHPISEEKLIQIEQATNAISISLEDHFEDSTDLRKLKLDHFEILCRSALNGDVKAWEHFAYNTLDLYMDQFFKFECFTVEEITQMAVLCAQCEDEHTESVTVQSIVDHLTDCQLSQERMAEILTVITCAYHDKGKIDQFIIFLNDEKEKFTSQQIKPLISRLDGVLITDREILMNVVELRKFFM